MGQSSNPAMCSCGAKGPPRGSAAINAGWCSVESRGHQGRRSVWLCPPCIEIAAVERKVLDAALCKVERVRTNRRHRQAGPAYARAQALLMCLLPGMLLARGRKILRAERGGLACPP